MNLFSRFKSKRKFKEKKVKGSFGITFTKKEIDDTFREASELKRVKERNVSFIVDKFGNREPSNIQDVKTRLDTMVIAGVKEKQAKKELRRLGFLA